VLKYFLSTFLKSLFIYLHVLHSAFFYGTLRHLFVYRLKTTFYLPPRITCCLFVWTTSTYSPFQHITIDYICHTHRLLIIMAKTNRTNPHSEEPIRHSNWTAGKSPASVNLPARKPAAARKATSAHKDTAARKDTAASPLHRGSEKFSGERKGPPEAIVPAPEAIVPRLPTLWEWTPPSGVDVLPVKPYFEPIIPMPTLVVGIDFAADHDFTAAVPRASRRYPGSNNGEEYYEMGGEEGKTGGKTGDKDYDMAGEEGKNGGEDYDDDEDYDSAPDDDGDNSRDADFVPKLFESSDDDDFNHLNDDNINEEDRRIENMDSKSRIPTGRRRRNLIMGGPVAPNYKLMSASEASEARSEYQTLRKN
jgi:hypothetical protein